MTQHLRADRSCTIRSALSLAILTIALLIGLPRAQAQSAGSSIIGTVSDESGAAVPGAKVTVLNVGTSEARSVETNERGDFVVPRLEVGNYEVSAELEGFSRAVAKGIRLQVDQVLRRNLNLQVGQVTEQITVEADAATIQTDDTTISTVIDAAKIRELPIPANRNLFRLALLAPGMSRGPASSVTTSSFGAGFGIAAQGQKVHNNNIILDGAPLRTAIHGVVRMRPSVEAIEEFRVESGWYSAEYGTQSGAQIITSIRSGTNEFHGVLFHFLRNDKLDARNFFENSTLEKNPLRRNTFGGVLSGPIVKNKTFFTANAEFLRERRASQSFGTYPTQPMKAGDLTEPFFRNADGSLKPVLDLTTGDPFANNQIPSSRISSISKNFFQFWPSPNFGSGQFNGTNNFAGATRNVINDAQFFLRVDHTFSDKDKIFGRYGFEDIDPSTVNVLAAADPRFTDFNPQRQQNAIITWTHFLSQTMLNELKVSYNRDIFNRISGFADSGFDIERDLGIPGQTKDPGDVRPTSISITGCCSVGATDTNRIWDESRRVADTMSFVKGNHSIKIGADWNQLRTARRTVSFVVGDFSFTGVHSGAGLGWADFMLDQPRLIRLGNDPASGASNAGTFPEFKYWRLHEFITDDWKITPNLTMNIGLRHEYNSVFKDVRGESRNVDLGRQMLFPEPGVTAGLHDPAYTNYAPRLGFAWRPFGGTKTVIRTGYGIFYNVNMINTFVPILAANPPGTLRIEETNSPGDVRIRMANADQASAILGRSSVSGASIDKVVGVAQQWNLNVQHELPGGFTFEVGYSGSKSDHFDDVHEANPFIPGTTIRPYSQFSSVEIQDNSAFGNYHGLLSKLERRFAQGFTVLQTYTWSKTMFSSFACCGAQRPNSPYDWRTAERGLAETDQRHRGTTAFLYELPWGKNLSGAAKQLIAGWQVNGVLILETGLPMHPTQSLAPVDDGCPRCNRRPNRVSNGNLDGDQRSLDQWFDTSAFALALPPSQGGPGLYGNSGRNVLTAPGLVNLDFSVFKNFPVSETQRIQLRWEMYNATNTPPFNPPSLGIDGNNFGRITSAGLGREMQFGLRWEF